MPDNQQSIDLRSQQTPYRQILGIRFYIGPMDGLLTLTKQGGLIVVPSAPVLTRLMDDAAHREAVEGGDFAITDSGFMVLLWLAFQRERLIRISGLRFIRALLQEPAFKSPGNSFWVMPTPADAVANRDWLNTQGFRLTADDCYLAPQYARVGPLKDEALLALIKERRPQFVMLNLGGGVQERLGFYLRNALLQTEGGRQTSAPYRPTIICTGAAIAFLSGRQTGIPVWADRLMLGWLLRSLSNPRQFLPRYWQSLRLVPLLWKHDSSSVASRSALRSQ
jgi:UDP-N-acetyl-D-mannosaminuronic acid transferase (WecB/TagA/CpsF family)